MFPVQKRFILLPLSFIYVWLMLLSIDIYSRLDMNLGSYIDFNRLAHCKPFVVKYLQRVNLRIL